MNNNKKQYQGGFVKFVLFVVFIILTIGFFSFTDPKETDDSYNENGTIVHTDEDLDSRWHEKAIAYVKYLLKKEYIYVKEKSGQLWQWSVQKIQEKRSKEASGEKEADQSTASTTSSE